MRLLAAALAGVGIVPWLPLRPPQLPTPPLARPCTAGQLHASVYGQGAGGALVLGVVATNTGSARCSLLGRPEVRLEGAPSVRVLPLAATPGGTAALRALRPGRSALLGLDWSNWCRTAPPPNELVVTAPGGGELRLPLRGPPPCAAPDSASLLGVRPFLPWSPSPRPFSRLPLRASIVGVPARESKLEPPRLRERAGGLLRYRVALTNVGGKPFRFGRCPLYEESLAPGVRTERWLLNCRQIVTIPARGRIVLAMELRVPATTRAGIAAVTWELAPETYLPPFAAARVLVTG